MSINAGKPQDNPTYAANEDINRVSKALSSVAVHLTLNGRIRINTLFRLSWQHKTEDVSWRYGQNPVLAMVFAMASMASVGLCGSLL